MEEAFQRAMCIVYSAFSLQPPSKLLSNYLILGTRFGKGMYTFSPPMANGSRSSAALGIVGFWRHAKPRFCTPTFVRKTKAYFQAEVCSDKPGYELK